jgi:hypothetical protein
VRGMAHGLMAVVFVTALSGDYQLLYSAKKKYE